MSKPPRFFITPDQILGTKVTLRGDDLHHVRTVLRKQRGDALTLLDGQGTEYTAQIVESESDYIICDVITRTTREITGPRVILGQGLPKSDKMDWIVQKSTELGVASIIPLMTERTIMKVREEERRIARWQKIAREAAMQSNRLDIPVVQGIRSFDAFIRSLVPGPRSLFLLPWEEGTSLIKGVLRSYPGAAEIVVLIGPEGGFSLSETQAAQDAGFHLVSLGPTILRTETAAMTVLSVIGYEYST